LTVTFEEHLSAAIAQRDMARSEFVRNLSAGTYPRVALVVYADRLARLVAMFPRRLAALASICPDRAARIALLENMLEEEGAISFAPVKGITEDERLSHTALILRFRHSLGDSSPDPADEMDESWFDRQITEKNFLGASAYLNLGLEGAAPATFAHVTPALRKAYGFTEKEVAFFSEHTIADTRHRQRAAELLERMASTAQEREQVIAGIQRGVLTWFVFHRNVHRAMAAQRHSLLTATSA
jgi:pyrroloquinoline-quinone synthase